MDKEKAIARWIGKVELVIEANDRGFIDLNQKESEFIDSIEIGLSKGKILTHPQVKWLNAIYERIE